MLQLVKDETKFKALFNKGYTGAPVIRYSVRFSHKRSRKPLLTSLKCVVAGEKATIESFTVS